MTATDQRRTSPGSAQTGGRQAAAGPTRAQQHQQLVSLASVLVAVGVLLTMLPMRSVFTDWSWFVSCVVCAAPYVAVVVAFRMRGPGQWWHVLLGLAASVLVLAWIFVPDHLLVGIVPTPSSLTDAHLLWSSARQSMQSEHAPLASTAGLRLLTAGASVLLVALTDVLGVLLLRPLLASAPLLEVLAVASATSGNAAHPLWFALAAVGFLLIVVSGTRLQDHAWGPSVDGSAGRLGGARRMAVTGIIAALLVPLALPSLSVNLLARAAHHNGDGTGSGGNQRVVLNNAADLRGSLRRGSPVDLFSVQVRPSDKPFYVRQVVLDDFTAAGWVQSNAANDLDNPVSSGEFAIAPGSVTKNSDSGRGVQIDAQITILNLGGSDLPLLANPLKLATGGVGVWDQATATVGNADLVRNSTYTERALQPNPTTAELLAAPDFTSSGNAALDSRYLQLRSLPSSVKDLADRIAGGKPTAYEKAQAISDYFTDGRNGFVYSLDTAPADGRDALVSFLDAKKGFCQQFAAAAAALMREERLPTRVVLGYTHQAPDDSGKFTVTTSDAHAWVEVYFTGVGWVAFDPTPLAGTDISRTVSLPWAPHPSAAPSASASSASSAIGAPSRNAVQSSTAQTSAGRAGTTTAAGIAWGSLAVVLGVLAILALLITGPHLVRSQQRRSRLDRGRTTGDPEPIWHELAATATDSGVLWPETVTVGQVPRWLAEHGLDERAAMAVSVVATGVERARYSATATATVAAEAVDGVDEGLRRWARRAERRQRVARWLLPRSLFGGSPTHRR
jgi:transglutaminase-like putative cysteine protease